MGIIQNTSDNDKALIASKKYYLDDAYVKETKKLIALAAGASKSILLEDKYSQMLKAEKAAKKSLSQMNDIFQLKMESLEKYINYSSINKISKYEDENKNVEKILSHLLGKYPDIYYSFLKNEVKEKIYDTSSDLISEYSKLGAVFLGSSELVEALSGAAAPGSQPVCPQDLPPIHEGPLNKTESTYLLEECFEQLISVKSLDDIIITTQHDAIEITVGGARYSLTYLLKNANLTHVFLTDDQISRLQALLNLTTHGAQDSPYSARRKQCGNARGLVAGGPFEHLPRACIEAIYAYTYSDHTYLSMNAFMQGNVKHFNQLKSLSYISGLLIDQPFKDNILLMLGLNLLVHHALNSLSGLLSQEYHQALAKLNVLTRLENFVDHEAPTEDPAILAARARFSPLQVCKARVNRVSTLASLTSTTRMKTPLYFQQYNTVTCYDNAATWPIASVSSCSQEDEVIIPASTQVYTTLDTSAPDDGKVHLKATFVRSPDFQQDRYWADVSFLDALDKYTTQYADMPESVAVREKTIVRPNHGAAHAYRKKLSVRYVYDYLSHYAAHSGHEIYASFTETLLQYLEIAAIRTGIGRESEKPSIHYREASKQHFLAFCADHKPFRKLDDEERVYLESSISFIIYIVGNPQYAAEIQAFSQDAEHEKLLHCIYHVLNLTHTLDLLRCYDAPTYAKKVAPYRAVSVSDEMPNLVTASETQADSFNELLRYSHELMQAHGNMQMTVVNNGQLNSSSLFYRSPFHQVSRRRQPLEVISAAVFPPVIQ